jgi:hypothetical protein
MFRLANRLPAVAALVGLVGTAPLLAQPTADKKPLASFIRLERNADKQPVTLQTSIVRYVPAAGQNNVTVDLIAVVHVGDRDYYQKLNKHFEQYDVLLYELVAPPGTRIPKGGKREIDNPLALLQQMSRLVLGLESQTEQIDYTKKNFVHADLSPEQMAEAIKNRGDDAMTLFLGIAADVLRQQNLQKNNPAPVPDIDITSLLEPDGGLKLKRVMAQQLAEMGEAGLGQTLNTILIADRNQAALKVMQKELVQGKKKIGIFYGAAHMPDFDKRLRADFGLKRQSDQWLCAWDLTKQKQLGIEDVLKLLK